MKKLITASVCALAVCALSSCGASEFAAKMTGEPTAKVDISNLQMNNRSDGYYPLFRCGLLAAKKDGRYGYIGETGEFAIEPKFSYVWSFSDSGLAKAEVYDDEKGRVIGYINTEGEFVIEPRFDSAGSFENGCARVSENDKYGYINEKGEYIIPPEFDMLGSEMKNGSTLYIVYGGDDSEKYGFISQNGEIIVEAQFDMALYFGANGLAPVMTEGKWGYINEKGEFVIEPQFEDAWGFDGLGYAAVKQNGLFGMIDERGRYRIKPSVRTVLSFEYSDCEIVCLPDGEFTCIDIDGNLIFQPKKYFIAQPFYGDLSAVGAGTGYDDLSYGYIDFTGELVIEPRFESAESFFAEGCPAKVKENGLYGYIDKKGEYVIPPQFIEAGNFKDDGYAVVRTEQGCGVIRADGSFLVEPVFDGLDIW